MPADNTALFLFIVCLLICFAVVMSIHGASVSKDALRDWADKNNYKLLTWQRRRLLRGPFWADKRCHVFRIVIEDQSGETHKGWFRCSGFWTGVINGRNLVRWDHAPGPDQRST